jgi:hypothetical protein
MKSGGTTPILRRHRAWVFGSALIAIALAAWGLLCFDHFGEHVLAEGIGIAASVPVTVLVVEAILDRRRSEHWSVVREQTGKTIETLVQQAAFDLHVALPEGEERSKIPSPAVLPAGGHATVLRRIAVGLRARTDADPAVIRLQNTLQQPLYHLVDRMGPRIYASGDPVLVQRFGALEEQVWAWERDRSLYEDLRMQLLRVNAADTADVMAELVEHAHALTVPLS